MKSHIKSMLSHATGSIGSNSKIDTLHFLHKDIRDILMEIDGFYAFNRSLLIRPAQSSKPPLGVIEWNQSNWISLYTASTTGRDILYFAEDIFSTQIGINKDGIWSFDPETADIKLISKSMEEWFEKVLSDIDYYTGRPIAKDWEKRYGMLANGNRLIPRIPFVLGGDYAIDNLVQKNESEAMKIRAPLANAIRDIPDGATLVIRSIYRI